MDQGFGMQLKKGVLEMLVLNMICEKPSYGYELLLRLKGCSGGRFSLKEGTLYPILYRLEDDDLIEAAWSQGEGRIAPKKIYQATEKGRLESIRRIMVWREFVDGVNEMLPGGKRNEQ